MIRKFCLTLAVLSTAFISIVSAQQTAKVTASGIGYLEYLPQGYHSNSKEYPVVIALHGIKEKGTSSTDPKLVLKDLEKVDNVGLPKYVKFGAKYPFILISPQLKSKYGTWPASFVMEVVNHVKKNLRIDESRIYLTGLSLGGFGVWRTAGEYPEVFAAIAPICAGGNALNKANDIAAKNLPAWGFHGSGDKIVSYTVTTKMINAINSAPKKPNPLAKSTIYPGLGHIIWDKVYQESNVLDWMLSHKKGSAPSKGDDDEDEDEDEDDDNDNGGKGDDDGDDDDGDDDGNDSGSNKAPVADAGSDKTITLPTNSLYIQGSAKDSDGKISSYRWSKVSGPVVGLTGTGGARLRAYNLKQGDYIFRLTAKDNDGATHSDDVRVTVKKSGNNDKPKDDDGKKPSGKNSLPVVQAGPDRVITLPTNSITIKGKATDKDGKIVFYEWAKTYGKAANFSGVNTDQVTISNLQQGIYIFRLRAKDNDGGVKDDYFKITVNGSDKGKTAKKSNSGKKNSSSARTNSSKRNLAPNVNAGPDRVVTLPGSLTIQGRASDRDGRIVAYDWMKTYGNRVKLSGTNTNRLRLSNMQHGIYIFRFSAKDNDGAVEHDYFKVTVKESGVAVTDVDMNKNNADNSMNTLDDTGTVGS